MALYEVVCRGGGRQVIEVEADTPEEAKECWAYHGVPVRVEVDDPEVVAVRQLAD